MNKTSSVKCYEIQKLLAMANKIYEQYSWVVNAYVSDFYVHNHWQRLPESWKKLLEDVNLETVGAIIDTNNELRIREVLPLSLMALRNVIKHLQIPRKQIEMPSNLIDNKNIFLMKHFKNKFWKHVKPKKKHEIELMSKMCYKLAVKSCCYNIVDVGSGLGHLTRMLSYGYGLKVCGLEMQECLTIKARKLDEEMEEVLTKQKLLHYPSRPAHINKNINMFEDNEEIIKIIEDVFCESNVQFGIVGLHPCGDLGVTLLRLFLISPQIKFINIVGCCYMKLSEASIGGYPLSTFSLKNNYNLHYAAKEVACHGLEVYVEKLQNGQYGALKIHAYRARLEQMIVEKYPDLFHSQMSNVKYSDHLPFKEYCMQAIAKSNIDLNMDKINWKKIENDLINWKNVVIFYSLRLMIAPLIETIILMDRILFLSESGYECNAIPIFDPYVSPRNQVLTGMK